MLDREADDDNVIQLSAKEVELLVSKHQALSPWQVIKWQVLVALVVVFTFWLASDEPNLAMSAAYGGVCVVLPAVVFARGLQRQKRVANVGSALGGFFVWEMIKVVLTVAMLFAAPKLVTNLNWLALLAGFVVTMKVVWVAMWLLTKQPKSAAKI